MPLYAYAPEASYFLPWPPTAPLHQRGFVRLGGGACLACDLLTGPVLTEASEAVIILRFRIFKIAQDWRVLGHKKDAERRSLPGSFNRTRE